MKEMHLSANWMNSYQRSSLERCQHHLPCQTVLLWHEISNTAKRETCKQSDDDLAHSDLTHVRTLFDANLMGFTSHVSYVWANRTEANLVQIFTLGKSHCFFTKAMVCSHVYHIVATTSWSSARYMLKKDVLNASITAFRGKLGKTTTMSLINRHTTCIGAQLCTVCVGKCTNIREPGKYDQFDQSGNMCWNCPMLI